MAKCKKILVSMLLHLELIIVSLLVLIPIFWIVSSSFNDSSGLASATLIPQRWTLNNYARLFRETKYGSWFLNKMCIRDRLGDEIGVRVKCQREESFTKMHRI